MSIYHKLGEETRKSKSRRTKIINNKINSNKINSRKSNKQTPLARLIKEENFKKIKKDKN